MKEFNSVFEIFAAFNFAYVFSADLLRNLNDKLGGNFLKASNSHESIDLQISSIDGYIQKSKEEGAHNSAGLTELLREFETKKSEYYQSRDSTSQQIRKSFENSNFNYLCLFAGLYSIFILLASSFDIIKLENESHVTCLFYINIFTAVGMYSLTMSKMNIWKTSHMSTVIVFSIAIILASVLYTFLSWCPFVASFVMFLSILLSSIHFCIYFIKIYLNQRRKGTELVTSANNWQSIFNSLNERLTIAINISSERRTTIKRKST